MNQSAVTELLRLAAEVVEEAHLPEDLRAVAFAKAVDLLAPSRSAAPSDAQGSGQPDPSAADTSVVESIASKLKLDRGLIDEILHEEDGEPQLIVAARRLGTTKKAGTRELALLLTAARQAGMGEEWTDVEHVREVARDYRKFDPNNFAATISEMDEDFRMTGTAQNRRLKLSRQGWQSAAALARRLAGGDAQ